MVIKTSRTSDPRCYNVPTAEEVGAIMIEDGQESEHSHRDIILRLRDGSLQRISELHKAYTPLHYVLLFPRGEDGWHLHIQVCNASQIMVENTEESEEIEETVEEEDDSDAIEDNNHQHVRKCNHITQMQYYAYQLQVRSRENSGLHRAGRLFQQYIVDAYATLEQNRLTYIKFNQKKVRSDLYQG